MPRLDGLEMLALLKGDPRLRQLATVVLTGSRQERDLVAAYELGTNAYVVKPVGFGALAAAVAQLGAFWAVVNQPPPVASATPAERQAPA